MITLIKKPLNISKIETYVAAGIYGFLMLLLLARVAESSVNAIWTPYRYQFLENHLHYSYSRYYFLPMVARLTLYFGAFLFWNRVIIPALIERRNTIWMVVLAIVLFGTIYLTCSITDTWLKGYLFYNRSEESVYRQLFTTNILYAFWVVMMLTIYSVIKQAAIYLLNNTEQIQSEYKVITRDGIIALVLWMMLIFGLLLLDAPIEIISLFFLTVPVAIGVHGLSTYNFIPATLNAKKGYFTYWLKVLMVTGAVSVPAAFIMAMAFRRPEAVAIILAFNAGFQLLITSPFSWITFKRRLAGTAELTTLKTELGTTSANLDFLRSQINPHFLFNALNTLYATSLQEDAERTAEGIQRLGDMMRFMLQENMHDKILLTREIDYLNNYITLQQLRTQTSPDIKIDVQIEDHIMGQQIAPMLLIPFIENAFKHGISLREPSHIKITLQTKENTLYFDVHNSIHSKHDNDPEKDKSGIGLVNVKQRLKLLYPGKHELMIRENASEFFVHLTIQLS